MNELRVMQAKEPRTKDHRRPTTVHSQQPNKN